MIRTDRFAAATLRIARAEGIALTPRGEALFARDVARLAEIRARDTRTPEMRAADTAEQDRIAAESDAQWANDARKALGRIRK